MPRYPIKGGGITKLSELIIDADKDWATFGIFNVKELAAGQAIGSVLSKDPVTGIMVGVNPGTAAFMLMTKGVSHLPAYGSY